jgi:aspartate carbamoyltransferase catalytic subunit
MKDDLKEYLKENGVPFAESLDQAGELKGIASRADILYITQIPRENFGDRIKEYDQSRGIFRIDREFLRSLKKDTYIMHPFPRGSELPPEIDRDPRAVYFEQVRYGQFLRMDLLCPVLRPPLVRIHTPNGNCWLLH